MCILLPFYFDYVAAERVPEVGADIGGTGQAQDARVVAYLALVAGRDAAGELVVDYGCDSVALDKAERSILKREKSNIKNIKKLVHLVFFQIKILYLHIFKKYHFHI